MEEPILLRIDPFLWEDPNLNYPEKIILNLVLSFTLRDECCNLTNEWIASKFGWTPAFVNDVIQLLSSRNLINISKPWNGGRNLSFYIPNRDNPCEAIVTVEATEINP
jgi:hypothetical protein